MAHAMNFAAWCLVSDEMNSNSATAKVFSCDGRGAEYCLIVWSVEAIEAVIDNSHKAFGTDHDWVSVDTNGRPV